MVARGEVLFDALVTEVPEDLRTRSFRPTRFCTLQRALFMIIKNGLFSTYNIGDLQTFSGLKTFYIIFFSFFISERKLLFGFDVHVHFCKSAMHIFCLKQIAN